MGAVVIDAQVDVLMVGHSPLNLLAEREELLVAVPTLPLHRHFAGGAIQDGNKVLGPLRTASWVTPSTVPGPNGSMAWVRSNA